METNEIRWWEVVDRPDKAEIIKKIESRKKVDVIKLLKINGVKPWTRDDHDYVRAKRLCFEEMFINSIIYDKQIKWICEYLGI